jgi:hypothetical protein
MGDTGPGELGPPRPNALTVSLIAWLVSVLAFVGGWAWSFYSAWPAFSEGADDVTPADRGFGMFAVTVILLLTAIPYVLLPLLMFYRHNWARITLAVFGGMGILVALFSLLGLVGGLQDPLADITPAHVAVMTLALVLTIIGLVTMFLPAVNTWFTWTQRR